MDRKRVLHMHGHARSERLESKPSDPKESEELGRSSARSPQQIEVAQRLSANRYAEAGHEQRGQSYLLPLQDCPAAAEARLKQHHYNEPSNGFHADSFRFD